MMRILIILLACICVCVLGSEAKKIGDKCGCVVVMPAMDSFHADLPDKISEELKANDIIPYMVNVVELSQYESPLEVRRLIIEKVDSLKKESGLAVGLMGISDLGGVAAMDASSDNNVDFLILISAIGIDGKEYVADSMVEMTYSGRNIEELSAIRKYIRNTVDKIANGEESIDEDLKLILGDNAIKRLMKFQVGESLDKIKCPVILTHLRYDGNVYWYPNLANLDKTFEKKGITYKLISPPLVNQYFEKVGMTIPGYISIQYGSDYTPNYDLSVFSDVASLIKDLI